MFSRLNLLRGLTREERVKAGLLSGWFFLTVATFWLLKPVRVATLLVHLGARETPYVHLAAAVVVAAAVMAYSALVNRVSRGQLVVLANAGFGAVLLLFWMAARVLGARITAERPFVWSIYVMVELYSVMLIGVFWTYVNDVVTTKESNRLYGLIGLGGILGGVFGGVFVDAFAKQIGTFNLLPVCAGVMAGCALLGASIERVLHPQKHRWKGGGLDAAFEGAREVTKNRYLMLLVVVVIAYEFTATLTDFGINVLFEREYTNEGELTKMYGRLGWIVSGTAIVSQLVLVPLLLPAKRVALLLPPLAMIASAVGVVVLPVIVTAMILSATDRGLNYSIQQSTWETLYVPLDAEQKYKAKAFIDMFVDRAAKAVASFVLIGVIATSADSVRLTLAISLVSMLAWVGSARRLGDYWRQDGAYSEGSSVEGRSRPTRRKPRAGPRSYT